MSAKNIDDVLAQLSFIIEQSYYENDRIGYFAALYRMVTLEMQDWVRRGDFENPALMLELDVHFANRYFEAVAAYREQRPAPHAWQIAFDSAQDHRLHTVQHLMLGINAHVRLDLGVSLAQVLGDQLENPACQRDFRRFNQILVDLVGLVDQALAHISPWFRWFAWFIAHADEPATQIGMRVIRGEAWNLAQQLTPLLDAEQQQRIGQRDKHVAQVGQFIANPVWLGKSVIGFTNRFERDDVPHVLQTLLQHHRVGTAWALV